MGKRTSSGQGRQVGLAMPRPSWRLRKSSTQLDAQGEWLADIEASPSRPIRSTFPNGLDRLEENNGCSSSNSFDSWCHGAKVEKKCARRRDAGKSRPTKQEKSRGKEREQSPDADPLLIRFLLETWKAGNVHFSNSTLPFIGCIVGCTHPYGCLLFVLGLWHKFFSEKMQHWIVQESNLYAYEVIFDDGRTRGGLDWTPSTLDELQAYIAANLYMEWSLFYTANYIGPVWSPFTTIMWYQSSWRGICLRT